jgi:hypothetical protein
MLTKREASKVQVTKSDALGMQAQTFSGFLARLNKGRPKKDEVKLWPEWLKKMAECPRDQYVSSLKK